MIKMNIIFLFLLSQFFLSCNSSVDIKVKDQPTPPIFEETESEPAIDILEVEVAAGYEIASSSSIPLTWNHYIKRDGANLWDYTGSLCDPNTDTSCAHAGELLQIKITNISNSCSNVLVLDKLNLFKWICIESGGEVYAFSVGLKPGNGLADLIETDGNSFKLNSIEIYKNEILVAKTLEKEWWTNQIIDLSDSLSSPAPQQNLNSSTYDDGTIFVISSDLSVNGINLDGDNYSLVTLKNANLSHAIGGTLNCESSSGEDGTNDQNCLISSGGQNFLWIEGNLTGIDGAEVIFLHSSKFSRVNNLGIYGGETGISLISSQYNTLNSVSIGWVETGIKLYTSDYNMLKYCAVTMANTIGILIDFSLDNVLNNIKTASNGSFGLQFKKAENNTLVNLVTANNNDDGLNFNDSKYNTALFITSINNLKDGLNLESSSDNNTISNVLAINNSETGIFFNLADWNNVYNLVSAHNGSYGMRFTGSGSYNNLLEGHVKVGNNGSDADDDCLLEGASLGSNSIDNDCVATGSQVTRDVDLYNAFGSLGMIKVFDSFNQSNDSNGTNTSDLIVDSFNFENFFRFWALDDSSIFPAAGNRGACIGAGLDCQILDVSLSSSASYILNTSYDFLGNGSFIPGSNCPNSLNGVLSFTDEQSNLFLRNAFEMVGDHIGDEDGLCEDQEDCIYAPNFGAYQGHGNILDGACRYDDGASGISAVNIFNYEYNGY